jgi:predicted nucleotidyltransferase
MNVSERSMNAADGLDSNSHRRAAEEFVRRVQGKDIDSIQELFLFGSTARGDASELDSDVDFLAVIAEDADRRTVADELRDIAYDVMLEFGPVVELHVLSEVTFERRRKQGNPFVRNVLREGRSYT